MPASHFNIVVRKSAKWLVLVLIAGVVFYRVKFAAVPVEEFEVKLATVVGEVMGMGTLEARVKTTISPCIQERLAEVFVDQGDVVSAGQLLARLDDGDARALAAPGWQARVMTSTLGGDSGPSFGWLNRAFIASRTDNLKFNNYGGEDRFWLGPEAGQFGLWFRPGNKFTLDDFMTPAGFNSGPFEVVSSSSTAVTMRREFEVTNYSGTQFTCAMRRTIRLLDKEGAALGLAAPIPAELRWVGFESINALTNAGTTPWKPETGLLCIWILGMFSPLPRGRVVAPFVPGNEPELGPPVSPYFGDIPPERLKLGSDHALFTCDGAGRTKIGISPRRARNVVGAWDPDRFMA